MFETQHNNYAERILDSLSIIFVIVLRGKYDELKYYYA